MNATRLSSSTVAVLLGAAVLTSACGDTAQNSPGNATSGGAPASSGTGGAVAPGTAGKSSSGAGGMTSPASGGVASAGVGGSVTSGEGGFNEAGASSGGSVGSGAGGNAPAGGSTSGAGGGGAAGSPTTQPGGGGEVPESCVGWASVNAEGVNGTTGGAGGPIVEIETGEELASYRRNLEPMTFRIMNDISGEIQLGPNKTVEGAKKGVTLNGGLVFSGKGTDLTNLIIRNLRINAASSSEDGIDIRSAHHVCIEHCEIFDGPDGNLDIVREGNYITVAYTKFYYTSNYKPLPGEPSPNHRYSNLIGNSDGATTDLGKLKVTYHHNWWGELVVERMPRIRFGEVHLFNNYFSAKGNNYGVGAGVQAKVVIENNFFEDMNDPHIFYEGEKTAQIVARGNEYVNVTGLKNSGQGPAFTPPYPYELDPAATVKATVMANAGPQ